VLVDAVVRPGDDDLASDQPGAAVGRGVVQEADPQAVRAAADGDIDAFESLVRAYQAPVWRFLRDLVGDPDLAQDLTQETFVRAFRQLRTFRFRSKFSTWLFRIARNVGIDALRSRARQETLLARIRPADPTAGPELGSELSAAVRSLSPKLREAMLLVEVVGLTCSEAGDVLGIPEGTVKSRLFTARGHLVTWLRAGEGVADEL
jgi:RNA polymerase sigma-70 factor (ECF subfamily)